jgi:hypothetical protein
MKKFLMLFVIIYGCVSYAQSDKQSVEKVLNNYIKGSSYNDTVLLKNSFAENATLYLSVKSGFKRFTPEEYANFFKNNKKGTYNGRIGKVLAIEVIEDIATAKVEIGTTKSPTVYMDLFLLKRINGNWKIISKTATRINTK